MDNDIPKKKYKKSELVKKTASEMTEFDLIPIAIENILTTSNDDVLVLLIADGKKIIFPLNDIEATMLTFIQTGCVKKSHINTIYHLYAALLQEIKVSIESATIETQDGDMWYARLKLVNPKNKQVYCQCTVGDAIVLSSFMETKLYIVRKALDEADAFEEEIEEDFFYEDE